MEPEPIRLKLDVTKILKEHLFHGKNGAKYLDVYLRPTPDSQYGDDYMATQDVSKEARESGVKGPILGNAKIVRRQQTQRPASKPAPPQKRPPADPDLDAPEDCPF